MILQKLKIENFGKIKHLKLSFDSQLAIISTLNADEIIQAIGLVTNNKKIYGRNTKQTQSNNTCISAELEINGKSVLLSAREQFLHDTLKYDAYKKEKMEPISPAEVFRSIRLCQEEENLTYYRFSRRNNYAERFLHYKDPDKYYSPGEFQKLTDGMGTTRSFRACLAEYIRDYKTEIFSKYRCEVNLLSDGRFVSFSANSSNDGISVNEADTKLFDFMCYIDVNAFWGRFEDIRNMNHEKWPMVIDGVALLNNPDYDELRLKAIGLGRQLIIKEAPDL